MARVDNRRITDAEIEEVKRANPVDDVVLEQLASSFSVLTDDEKELGVCLVDIGGGTTDLAVFSHGAIRHTAVIPIAGDQVTNDIAVSMRTPTQHAEDIKIRYACALSQLANPDESIEVPSVGERPARRLARQTLAEIVEPRYEELFALVRDELRRSGFEEVIAAGTIPPVVNQVQFSPLKYRRALLDACQRRQVAVEAFSPLGTGRHLFSETVGRVAKRTGRTPAQVLLRWSLQRGLLVIPKSVHPKRIAENAQIFDFTLSEQDMAELDAIDQTNGTDQAQERKWW